jgi:DNA-binding CsgD family transcriptional regulator
MIALDSLTERQRDCLREYANFRTHKEIARTLGISDSMVEKHLRQAREKLGVETTAEAARLYLIKVGEAVPQGGITHLSGKADDGEGPLVAHGLAKSYQMMLVGDASTGAVDLDHPLTVLQTLSLIGRLVVGSIIGLSLLIASAEGLKAILT